MKKKTKKLKILSMFLSITIIIGYTSFAIYKLVTQPTSTFIVSNGTVSQEESVKGYVVREEDLVEGERKTSIIKIKQDGEKIAKGDAIYRYVANNEVELERRISDLNVKIQEAMESSDNTFSSDKKILEEQIETEINNVYKSNELQKIKESKKNINIYIEKRARIVGEKSPAGSYIKQLIEEKSDYENELKSEGEYIVAPKSGIVSYRIDGLENVLVPTDFEKINKEFLESLNIKTDQTIATNDNTAKIINNYKCYIVFNSNSEEAKNTELKDTIKIKIQTEKEIKATVVNIIIEEDNSRTITLEIKNEVEGLIDYRKVSFEIIWWSKSGFRVPNSSITEINGITYVIRNRNGYTNKMAVKILNQNEDYSIIKAYTREELLAKGLSSAEIANLKTITLYDEIMLNATK